MSNPRPQPLYFGCWRAVGHHLRTVSGRDVWRDCRALLPWRVIDGVLTPLGNRDQGAAALHHLDGWTAIAWHDYTVDSRGAANSVVFLPGTFTFAEALLAAREAFLHVLARQPCAPFEVAAAKTGEGPTNA